MFKLFWVTDRTLCPGDFLSRLEAIAKARPDGIILREKDLAPEDYRALAEEVTPRQRQVLALYYQGGLSLDEIGQRLDIHRSTVSRTLKRGEDRLRRCLRYGSPALLESDGPRRRGKRLGRG